MIGGATQEPPPPDPVQEDKKKRQYLSLFAANVAFTSRKEAEREQLAGQRVTDSAGNVETHLCLR